MLAARLRAARRSRFVGRIDEQALFISALQEASLPFQVLYIFGPGGVGKTTLLWTFAYLCEELNALSFYIDVRNVEPSPEAFLNALRQTLRIEPTALLSAALAALPGRCVILIDTYETLASLDDWLRENFLAQLPDDTLVVLAGRQPPTLAWRSDPGWQTISRTISLRNLERDASRDYLVRREVPADQHDEILRFTHGHPLALSLVADAFAQRKDIRFQPEAVPDIVKTLLAQFAQKVPGPAHRAALEACALVRLTTESLLGELLSLPDAHELFEWLSGLSFVEAGLEGVFPHDLAREALAVDLRWRNPDWYAELHRRARAYYLKALSQTNSLAQQRVLWDYVYLHRDNPVVKPYFEWQAGGNIFTDAMQPDDVKALNALVVRHEGDASAQLASYWFARRPMDVTVWRDTKRSPVGFLLALPLHELGDAEIEADPAVRSTLLYLRQHAPLRAAEVATLFRFWMDGESYQSVSPVQSLIFVNMVRHYLRTQGLAYTFIPCADPDFWGPVFAYGDLTRISPADFAVEGRRFGVYGHDWRIVPPMAWLTLLGERETAASPETIAAPQVDPLIVLSKDEFEDAVRTALRDFSRLDVLRSNPLTRSRLVTGSAGLNVSEEERASILQKALREVVELLNQSSRDVKAYRALYHTYIQPAPTQEQAAELLDLPFSTYRRHLKQGLTQVMDNLWHREIGHYEK